MNLGQHVTTLLATIQDAGFSVEFGDPGAKATQLPRALRGGCLGLTSYDDRRVTIKRGLSTEDTLRVALHEAVHALCHGVYARAGTTGNVALVEAEAELATGILLTKLGLKIDRDFMPYLTVLGGPRLFAAAEVGGFAAARQLWAALSPTGDEHVVQ